MIIRSETRLKDKNIAIALFVLMACFSTACILLSPLSLIGFEPIPNITGLPLDQATNYLDQGGFAYQITYRDVITREEVGMVIDQSPKPGGYLLLNNNVEIIVGSLWGSTGLSQLTPIATQPITQITMAGPVYPTVPSDDHTQGQTPPPFTETPSITPTQSGPTQQAGGGGRIAFASDRSGSVQVWLVNLDGSDPQQLTDIAGGACQPDWSPDGSRLVFISPCNGNIDIYNDASLWLINAGGSGLEELPGSEDGDFDPAWSPDGSSIAFSSTRDTNYAQIYLMNMSDHSVKKISTNKVNEIQPAWSPDGRQLVYASTQMGYETIFIRMLETSNARQFSREVNRSCKGPIWSPDGNLIFYTQSKAGGVPVLLAAGLEDVGFKTQRVFSQYPMPMRDASLSPDGLWIAFESWLDGVNHDIWIGLISGTQPLNLTEEKSFDFDPDWQP